jgi:hypothetical protein
VVATDAAAFLQTISGSGLKPMTVPNLPQETCWNSEESPRSRDVSLSSARCMRFLPHHLTMERKPPSAAHIECEVGIRVLTPISYWERLRPWAGLRIG